jgi:hypothetical protein
MSDRNQTKKVRTVTYIYLICLLVLIGLYPACSIEEQPPAMLEIHAAGVSQSSEGRALQAVISDPETCTSLGVDSQTLVYDEDRDVFTCSMIEPEDGDYVIVVKDLDGECFGAVASADIENGQLFVPLRQRYTPGQTGPTGGIIFMEFPLVTYLETGNRYLEAYPTDSVTPSLMLTHAEASSYCDDAELSGKTDWFLPAVTQLEALEMQVSASVQSDPPYWSSEKSEGVDRFLLYYMKERREISDSGVTKYPVWPVRSF